MNSQENLTILSCPHTGSNFLKTKNSYICEECELKIPLSDRNFTCPEFVKKIVNTFPYPIASIYFALEDKKASLKDKRHALYFTVYQLMRCISLPFISAYLYKETLPETLSEKAIDSFNSTLVKLRSPYFSDWIAVLFKIAGCQSDFGISIFDEAINNCKEICGATNFKQLMDNIRDAKVKVSTEYALEYGRRTEINLLEAFLGLRNATAHAGRTLDEVCHEDIQFYRPLLDELLKKFYWIGNCRFLQLNGNLFDERTKITRLCGAQLPQQEEIVLSDNQYKSFKVSPIIIEFPVGNSLDTLPLYPFIFDQIEGEKICSYDGHNLRDDVKSPIRVIYYLGNDKRYPINDQKIDNLPDNLIKPGEKLRELLQRRKVRWELSKEDLTPFTLADCANEFSSRTVEDQIGKKYLPECYLEREDLSKPLYDFLLETPIDKNYSYRGMFWLGNAGSGKTALFTQTVYKLLSQKHHIVFFLRGDSIYPYEKGDILFQNIIHKIGLKAKDFSNFTELFNRLKDSIKNQNEKPNTPQRFILVLDALNEAPFAHQVIEETIDLLKTAKNYPFIRVVFSIRSEAFAVLRRKRLENQSDLLDSVKPLLLPIKNHENENDIPAYICTTLEQNEAAEIYKLYQTRGQACFTSWDELPLVTKQLLLTPLYLHLFHEVFQNKNAEDISGEPISLFEAFINEKCKRNTFLKQSLQQLSERMLKTARPDFTDSDALEMRQEWQNTNVLTEREINFRFSPMEIAEMEGIVQKRVGEGGYRIVFQTVREFLLFQAFKHSYQKMTAENALEWDLNTNKYSQLPEYNSIFYWLMKFYIKENRVSDAALLYSSKLSVESKQHITNALRDSILSNEEDFGTLGLNFTKSIVITPGIEHENIRVLYNRINVDLFDSLIEVTHCATIADILSTVAEKLVQLHQSGDEDAEFAHSLYISYIRLGDMACLLGNLEEANSYFEKGLGLAEKLYQKFPNNTKLDRNRSLSYSRLGQVMKERGNLQSAQKYFSEGMEIIKYLYQAAPHNIVFKQDLAAFYNNFGEIAIRNGKPKEAIEQYEQALKLTEELSDLNPNDINYLCDLAAVYNRLGKAYLKNDVANAYEYYLLSSKILNEVAKNKSQNIVLITELSNSYDGLGETARVKKAYLDAVFHYEQSLKLRLQLYQQFPNNIEVARKLSMLYNKLGDVAKDNRNFDEAMGKFDQCLEIRKKLYSSFPGNKLLVEDLSSSYTRISNLLFDQGDLEASLEIIDKNIKLQEELYNITSAESSSVNALIVIYKKAGNIAKSRGYIEKSEEYFRKAENIANRHLPQSKSFALTGSYAPVKSSSNENIDHEKTDEVGDLDPKLRFGTTDFSDPKLRVFSTSGITSEKFILTESDRVCFTVIEGVDFGRVFLLESPEIVLGRNEEADIQIDDERVSRKHLRFSLIKTHKGEARVKVADLNSKNGIFVNGVRAYEQELRSGDKIKLGDTILKFEIKDQLDISYHDKLYQQATRDPLTGLSNRHYFHNQLRRFISLSLRYSRELSIIILDIDFFKKINDDYGHDVGDQVLKEVAKILIEYARTNDVTARFGGEEFVMLLPETNLESALVIAERVRVAVENHNFEHVACRHSVTISIGVAEYVGDTLDGEDIIKRADEGVYLAKNSGRNRVCIAHIT